MAEVLRFEQVSLWRRTQEEFSYDFKRLVISILEGKYRQPARKLILDNIDFSIQAGEKVGIVGANGSGKSTLLKLVAGILQPTSGTVRVRGSISPLIELGAGFDPDLSVQDNIILYGVMLGFSRQEMRSRISEILRFAELEDYILLPLKGLSSGMVARLGFAIATDVKPDILILDEVLSVGDERFKKKCQQRLETLWNAETAILVVSHDLEFVRQACDRLIWLDRGCIAFSGLTEAGVRAYLDFVQSN